jgi:hypothetical protein
MAAIETSGKLRRTLATVFNILAGKEGWRAAVCGWAAVAGTGLAAVVPPLWAAIDLATAAVNADCSYNYAKTHDQRNDLKL